MVLPNCTNDSYLASSNLLFKLCLSLPRKSVSLLFSLNLFNIMSDFSENHLQDRKYKIKIKNQTSRDWVGIVMILFFRLMCCKVGWASALGDGREVQLLPFLQTFFMTNQIILAQVYTPFLACQ